MSRYTFHTVDWLRFGIEVLKLLLAAVAGATGGAVVIEAS